MKFVFRRDGRKLCYLRLGCLLAVAREGLRSSQVGQHSLPEKFSLNPIGFPVLM